MARPFQLTAFPPGTTVYVVEKTTANDHPAAVEYAPDARISSATVPRQPEDLGEILATVVTDESGRATIPPLPARGPNSRRFSGHGLPQKRYWAIGLVADQWQRVSFSMRG